MSSFPTTGPWLAIRKDLVREQRRPVIAVIGYVGATAQEVMPLRRGDVLVCDASEIAIRQGLTSAQALGRYLKSGVAVASCPGLHAKVISSPTSAWIGSANASTNSRDTLIEASLRVTGDHARQLHTWAKSMATSDRELTKADIEALKTIPVRRSGPGPAKETTSLAIPDDVSCWHVFETGEHLSDQEKEDIRKDRGSAKRAIAELQLPSTLSFVYWFHGSRAKKGEWIVHVDGSRVSAAGQIVRVKRTQRGEIVWFSPVKLERRPRLKELETVISHLHTASDHTVITKPSAAAVTQLFKPPSVRS